MIIKYRPDIDGLRAVAVIAVVTFHAFPQSFRAGFVGVDIFFVISGYLISGIIFESLKQNRFSFIEFYTRRVLRIFPALLLVMITCIFFGWFGLLAGEFKSLGKHVAAAAAFLSNIVLWKEAGYFDSASELKPLLHLWSLGVEEQFYWIWPALLVLLFKVKNLTVSILVFAICASLIGQVYTAHTDAVAAFYSPFFRIWEMAFGSILAHFAFTKPNRVVQNIFSFLGTFLICIAFFKIKEANVFSKASILLPVIGTGLLLTAGPNAFLNRRLLSLKFLIAIGLISYPLYLWHWPLLAFARIFAGAEIPVKIRVALILTSLIFALLTYVFVEKPFKKREKRGKKALTLCVLMAAIGLFAYGIYIFDGIETRSIVQQNSGPTDNVEFAQNPVRPCDPRILQDPVLDIICKYYPSSKPNRPNLLLWGDSSTWAWSPVFLSIAYELKLNVFVFSQTSCAPLVGIRKTQFSPESKKFCNRLSLGDSVVRSIKNISPQLIVYIGAWNAYTTVARESAYHSHIQKEFITELPDGNADVVTTQKALQNKLPLTIRELASISPLVVFRTWPILSASPNYQLNRIPILQLNTKAELTSLSDHKFESKLVDDIFDSFSDDRISFFDPSKAICDDMCKIVFKSTKMYIDTYHITPQGSLLYKDSLSRIIKSKVRQL